jgi:hypothetical protein
MKHTLHGSAYPRIESEAGVSGASLINSALPPQL